VRQRGADSRIRIAESLWDADGRRRWGASRPWPDQRIDTMPTNKDFKRLVRARMQKTGEAYTAARAQLLSRPPAPTAPVSYTHLTLPTICSV